MEDSYTVHRRRKAAAKKRDKTPEPQVLPEEATDDDGDARQKMEKMVEDTERMEQETRDSKTAEEPKEEVAEKNTPDSEETPAKNRSAARESDVSDVRVEAEGEKKIEKADQVSEAKKEVKVQGIEKPVRARKKARESYGTDSSDVDNEKRSLRRKKSPEDLKGRPDRKKTPSRSRREVEDEVQDKRGSSRHRYSESEEESGSKRLAPYKKKVEEKASNRDKRSSSRHAYSSDSDDNRVVRSRSMKKQVIPLRDDSLVEDLARAHKEYVRREYSMEDEDEEPISNLNVRRRRKVQSEDDNESKSDERETKDKSWFSWIPFFGKKKQEKVVEPVEDKPKEVLKQETEVKPDKHVETGSEKVTIWEFFKAMVFVISEFKEFMRQNPEEVRILLELRNACINGLVLGIIYCGIGGFIFRFTEGAFESFYKCGVKRVKRDFLDSLWNYSHSMKEDDWKSMARRKLMEFEEQIHTAHEAGVQSYSGQRSWTFLNAVVYCLTIVTTIGYGHISPSTTTGRAITIVYAIFGIPMFLIILADFGKLFTRGIKFLWAFVRRVYYTGSCRKVRRTVPVQEVMKGVQLVYDLATFRRPSQMNPEELEEMQKQGNQSQTVLNLDGNMSQQPDTPGTPAMSTFDIDDEFNLPISVAIFILLGYIFVGATLFYMWEDWGFFESFYFVFISMSTIGFGDYVPNHPIYMMCSIVYLVFGLALTSMCINVVQVMLSDQFQHASQKIGATMGLQVAEDDGSVQPAVPPEIEIPDVHSSRKGSKEKVAPKAKQEEDDL